MNIKLKETINTEITALGLRPGNEVTSQSVNPVTGAVYFTRYYNSYPCQCVVWPEDYEVVETLKTL